VHEELELGLLELARAEVKLRGLISLRNALPICAIPNGIFWRAASRTRLKSLNSDWQVSGRRYATAAASSDAPTKVLSIRLNERGSVQSCSDVPSRAGQAPASSSWSARKRFLQARQSTIGSLKWATWPLASQVRGCATIALSTPSTSSRPRTVRCHQKALRLFLSSTPSGP
jgi:hypothetical protein